MSQDIMIITGLILGLFVLRLLYTIIRMYWFRKGLPPGPLPKPVFGNLLELLFAIDVYQVLEDYSNVYGDCYTFWLGSKPVIVTSSVEAGKFIFVRNGLVLADRPRDIVGTVMKGTARNISHTVYDDQLAYDRKTVLRIIRDVMTTRDINKMAEDGLNICFDTIVRDRNNVDIRYILNAVVAAIISELLFDDPVHPTDPFIQNQMNASDQHNKISDLLYLLNLIPGVTSFFKLAGHFPQLAHFNVCEKEYCWMQCLKAKQRANACKTDNSNCIYGAMLATTLESKENGLRWTNDEHIINILVNLVGIEPPSDLLYWCLLELALHPQWQENVYTEISNLHVAKGSSLKMTDAPLVEGCILEAMRLHPSPRISSPREAGRAAIIGEWKIPKGTAAVYLIKTAYCRAIDTDDCQGYDPARYVRNPDEKIRLQGSFGFGRRTCLGQKIALKISFFVLINVLRRHKLEVNNYCFKDGSRTVTGNTQSGAPRTYYKFRITDRINSDM